MEEEYLSNLAVISIENDLAERLNIDDSIEKFTPSKAK